MSRKNIACKMQKIGQHMQPHYLIIGHYIKEPIGCCCGRSGKRDVIEEEPISTFKRIPKRKCQICNGK